MRRSSDLTVTDVFCGAGGNTIGAKAAGLRVRNALNHWDRAIETYAKNNRDVDIVEKVDVSLCDPRRYHSTDIGIFSPECTTHSPAGGGRHRGSHHPDLFAKTLDPATVRSRVTMFDVIRFAEFHQYPIVVVENVTEVTKWELFDWWLQGMLNLGYHHRILSLNSMFFWPTPQSRDRVYLVFWKKGNRAPDLEFRPLAPCPVHGHVNAVQTWKNGRTIGKLRTQYVYSCPVCRRQVTPFYFAALNAIDFALPAERIGDRERPLKPRTMERILFGLRKYGGRRLVVQTNMTSRLASRVRDAEGSPMPTQPASVHHGIVSPPFLAHLRKTGTAYDAAEPLAAQSTIEHDAVITPPNFVVALANAGGDDRRQVGLDEPLRTIHASGGNHGLVRLPGYIVETAQSHENNLGVRSLVDPTGALGGQQSSALVMPFVVTRHGGFGSSAAANEPLPGVTTAEGQHAVVGAAPFVTTAGSRESDAAASDPMPAQTGSERFGVVQPQLVTLRTNGAAEPLDSPMRSVAAQGTHHGIVQGAALLSLRDANAMHVGDLAEPTKTMIAAPQSALIATAAVPFLTSYYSNGKPTGVDEAAGTITGLDRHGLATPESLRVEDCYFRMLQPHEIGAAMAFPRDYVVDGTKRDRVKMYGNAVTPPVMDWIVGRCAQSLAPEVSMPNATEAA